MIRTNFTREEADQAFADLDQALASHPLPRASGGNSVASAEEFMLMHADDAGRLHFKHEQTRNYLILDAGDIVIPATGRPFQEGVF